MTDKPQTTRQRCAIGCTYSKIMDQPYPRICVVCGVQEAIDPQQEIDAKTARLRTIGDEIDALEKERADLLKSVRKAVEK